MLQHRERRAKFANDQRGHETSINRRDAEEKKQPKRRKIFCKKILPKREKFTFIAAPRRKSHHIIARMAELVDALD